MTDTSNKTYDTIIVGGGHNGLACAAYLAKAGCRVLVLESKPRVGGAAVTEGLGDGKRVSSCAHYLNQLNVKVANELKLYSHGLEVIADEVPSIALAANGEHLTIGSNDISGAGVSNKDVEAYREFRSTMCKFTEILDFLVDIPPMDFFNPDWKDKIDALKLGWKLRFGLGAPTMSEFLRQVGMNIYDVLDDEFDNPLLKGALSFDAVLGTHSGPRSPGSVFTYLYRMAGGNNGVLQVPAGGMGSVSRALASAAESAGAEIRANTRVAQINVENCMVTGVTLDDGKVLKANRVASNADPKSTVMQLVGPRHFEADFVQRVDNIRMRGNAAKLHIALQELPRFNGLEASELKSRLLIAPDQDEVERAFNHVKYQEVSTRPMMEISIPSIQDPTLARQGHVLSAIVQYAPYNLKGGWTDQARECFLQSCIDRIADYAPGFQDQIEYMELMTPADLEHRFGLSGGNWHHGELGLDSMLMLRPTPQASRYALPLAGLFLCGAGAHPGGGVMGVAGKHAAHAILKAGTTDGEQS